MSRIKELIGSPCTIVQYSLSVELQDGKVGNMTLFQGGQEKRCKFTKRKAESTNGKLRVVW